MPSSPLVRSPSGSRSRCGSRRRSWEGSRTAGRGRGESFRGAGGGCRIARDPDRITVAEIADAIEGQIYPVFCLEPSDHTCFADSRCGLQGFWADVATAVQQVFERTTVADLAARHREMSPGTVMVSPEELLSRLN